MISIRNLNKYFNKNAKNEIHVINQTSLEFATQGMIAIFGKSGCGKTTLLNVIGGLDKQDSGEVLIDNQKITVNNEYIKNIRSLQLYDTGITAEFGDELLTLSTCEYSAENGRLVLVCKKIW